MENNTSSGPSSQDLVAVGEVINFEYTGSVQTKELGPGKYKLEVWGAQGGTSTATGGKGGYSTGNIMLSSKQTIYAYVGGAGSSVSSTTSTGGFNGGGGTGIGSNNTAGGTGGGASDFRILGNTLYARLIVAGGGGRRRWRFRKF